MNFAEQARISRLKPEDQKLVSPDIVDVLVGRKLKAVREERGYPLTALAGAIGISDLQLEKHERAAYRMPPSRLYRIAQALEVEVGVLFADLPRPARRSLTRAALDRANLAISPHGWRMLEALRRLSPALRDKAVGMFEALVDSTGSEQRTPAPNRLLSAFESQGDAP